MKIMYQIRLIILFAACIAATGLPAQTMRDSLYGNTMRKALEQFDSARNVQRWQQVKNLFERIALKYSGEWLPAYYAAYCNVNSVFHDIKSPRNEAILSETEQSIGRLYDFSEADRSEVNTLKAFFLTAKIAIDPQVNGQKYFAEVVALYEKAMEENPANPRPVILLSDFEERLPAFVRSGKRYRDEECSKARALFDKEMANTEKPYWGKYFMK